MNSYIKCRTCNSTYMLDENLPHILPCCGVMLCANCLSKKNFCCNNELINKSFPINREIIKFLQSEQTYNSLSLQENEQKLKEILKEIEDRFNDYEGVSSASRALFNSVDSLNHFLIKQIEIEYENKIQEIIMEKEKKIAEISISAEKLKKQIKDEIYLLDEQIDTAAELCLAGQDVFKQRLVMSINPFKLEEYFNKLNSNVENLGQEIEMLAEKRDVNNVLEDIRLKMRRSLEDLKRK